MATPAEPAPFTTTRQDSFDFPTTFNALMTPASTTMAVPCWSSWKTGMSRSSFNRSSISKHLGAEMSSRLMPPKAGAIFTTVRIISSVSCVSRQIGTALTCPNSLNRTAFPSMTGIAARAPILPRPRTALPSETTATVFAFMVYLYTASGSLAITLQGSATPGVYATARSSLERTWAFAVVSIFPFQISCIFSAFSNVLFSAILFTFSSLL